MCNSDFKNVIHEKCKCNLYLIIMPTKHDCCVALVALVMQNIYSYLFLHTRLRIKHTMLQVKTYLYLYISLDGLTQYFCKK